MELQGGLFHAMTFHGEAGVLPEVGAPVFHQKNFLDHPGPHQIAVQSPAEGSVAQPHPAQSLHGLEKGRFVRRVDLIGQFHQHRALARFRFPHKTCMLQKAGRGGRVSILLIFACIGALAWSWVREI